MLARRRRRVSPVAISRRSSFGDVVESIRNREGGGKGKEKDSGVSERASNANFRYIGAELDGCVGDDCCCCSDVDDDGAIGELVADSIFF